MNDINFDYVVLRNWDGLPYDVKLGEHSDLDLLVYDFNHFFEIFPYAKLVHDLPRVRTRIPIDDSFIYVDVRHVGDNYYPEDFERNILETKEWNSRGFYTPNPIHHRIALAYHAVHHKNDISRDYLPYLGDAKIEELVEVLKESKVGWTIPDDHTVGQFHGYWKGYTSVVQKKDNNIVKTQTGYLSYPLIQNEYDKLEGAKSIHFPKVYGIDGNTIIIEDCGEHLDENNLPYDWETQLSEILTDLDRNNIIHRDIRLDNLMVKFGIIKLIDFGWSVYKGETFKHPSCLGFPNKPSSGFNDVFSMRQVKKQIDYKLEEKGVTA